MTDDPSERPAPIPLKEWPPGMRDAMAAMTPPNPRRPFPPRDDDRPKGLNALGTFAHNPEAATAFYTFSAHLLFQSTLLPRYREVIVLRVAARRDEAYEWAQHVFIATEEGFTPEQIEQIRTGEVDESFGPFYTALVTAADELLDDACLSDATWAALSEVLDTQQMLDVILTVGAYDALAMVLRTFDVPIDDDLRKWASPK
jgi:alkylhydroperoxidase family enzyme